jgi:hypothetical protein
MLTRELVEIDDTTFPLIFVEMSAVLSDASITSMFEAFDRVLARNARFAAVIDTTPLAKFPEARERKRITEWMKQRIAAEALFNMGNGLVVDSAAARAAIAAVNWLRRPTNPQAAFSWRWEAVDWCCERLRDAHIELSPAILARRVEEHKKDGRVPGRLGGARASSVQGEASGERGGAPR